MNLFRTPIPAGVSSHTLTLADPVLTIGSCFADCIGQRLADTRVPVLANPFGTLYNPHSIHKALDYALADTPPTPATYLRHRDVHLNYDFHSELSDLDENALKARIEDKVHTTHQFLREASMLMITYGTAWAYTHNDTREIVANCHKQPAAQFTRSLFTTDAMLRSFESLHGSLMHLNPSLHIILTVSPVRHIKDTLELNSVSKSTLRVACHLLQERYKGVTYFPAYEMMLDDLRDYRFYAADMIHPSPEAEEYIWNHFTEQHFSPELKTFAQRWKVIRQALAHKPFHPTSQAHQEFLRDTLKKLEALKSIVNVDAEIGQVRAMMV